MMEKTYWLRAITPIHVGAGRGIGYIDLPIVREKVTNWPYVPGSAVKGVILDKSRGGDMQVSASDIDAAFGRAASADDAQVDPNAGSIVFSDASIICLPVRSFYGAFAWITCPMALKRLRGPNLPSALNTPGKGEAFTLGDSAVSQNGTVYLEDIDLEAMVKPELQGWRDVFAKSVFPGDTEWQNIFTQRFTLVNDDIFTYLCETGTEVSARIRICDKTKTAAGGALWYEESLPLNAILSGVVWCDKVFGGTPGTTQQHLMDTFCLNPYDLQIGGKASIGKGRVVCLFS
jgi:CRISPR-associated protein Cmr4